nr:MAG TPA_asm: hypothetical protein [Caudoviricetes sp.]
MRLTFYVICDIIININSKDSVRAWCGFFYFLTA